MRKCGILIIVTLLLNTFVIAYMSVSADVIYSGICGDNLTWTIDAEGTLTISGTGDMWDYKDYPQNTSIDEIAEHNKKTPPWYKYSFENVKIEYIHKINKVVVEAGVTSIGSGAFAYCESESFIMADTIKKIGEAAFSNCNMYEIALPKELVSIGRKAFACCEYLNNVSLPDSVMLIDSEAFYGCERLENIIFGENTEVIGYAAFKNCDALTNIWLPKMFKAIYESALSLDVDFRRIRLNIFYEGNEDDWGNIFVYPNNKDINWDKTRVIYNVTEKSPFKAKYARKLSSSYFEIVGEFCGNEISLFPYSICEEMIYGGYNMDVDFEQRKTMFKQPDKRKFPQPYRPLVEGCIGECFQIYPSDWKVIVDDMELGWVYNIGGYTLIRDRLNKKWEG